LKQRFYYTGQFAEMAAVSERTLRYYDRVGLLSPTQFTESGYRLYTEQDFARLQYILALKYLGFSLEAIRECLHNGPQNLPEMLAVQKKMLREKRAHMDTVIQTIERAERRLQAEQERYDWEPLVQVIKVMQMEQQKDWQDKYFSPEQRAKMEELSHLSYSEEARQTLAARMAERPWTEEDQKRADEQWNWVYSELRRLIAVGADPASPEAQHWEQVRRNLLLEFTGGDAEVRKGLTKFWEHFWKLPENERPFTMPKNSPEEQEFIKRTEEIYRQQQQANDWQAQG
jgi:MerR family transcriptional regulator, thiopeptide resistance regulator